MIFNIKLSQIECHTGDVTKTAAVDRNALSLSLMCTDTLQDNATYTSGILGSTMNMCNAIVGSGILTLSYSTAQVGWCISLIIMFLGVPITLFGLHLLHKIADKIGGRQTSYGGACELIHPLFVLVADLITVSALWAVAVMYITIAGSLLPDVVRQFTEQNDVDLYYQQSWFWLIICWGCIGFPLSMLKSLWFLSYTSLVAVVCVIWTAFVVFAYAIGIFDPCEGIESNCKGEFTAAIWNFNAIMRAIPIFLVSCTVGPVIFNIYNTMDKQTSKRMDTSAVIALSVVTVLNVIITMCGYFTYGSNVSSNILDSYPISTVASIARVGTAFVVTVSYPLLMHPARDACIHAINTLMIIAGMQKQGANISSYNTRSGKILYYTTTIFINILAFILAYFNVNINTLLSITGAIGNSNLCYTFPAIIYWRMFEAEGMSADRVACIPLAATGIFVMGVSSWANFS
eukprot:CFRG5908T1